jgi:hypothetical protein
MPHTNELLVFYTSTAWQLLVLTERPASTEQIQMPPLAFFTVLCCVPCCVLAAHSIRAGPKAMIINQFSGSGGDWMPFHFKQRGLVRTTPLLAPFMYKMHRFTKTGSGQT